MRSVVLLSVVLVWLTRDRALLRSPDTISALEEERAASERVPNSPRPMRRRSSTGPISPALRPVLIERDDDSAAGSAVQGEEEEGPVPTSPHSGPAIDEVELIFHR